MPFPYTTYRILCSTPSDLDAERMAFLAANAKFGEDVALPAKVLFAVASLATPTNANVHRSAIENNIRMADFFVHVFGDTAPESIYTGFVDFALDCLADPAKPLRSVAVLFKVSAETTAQVHKIRDDLKAGGRCQVLEFRDSQELDSQFRFVLEGWYALAQAAPNAPD